MPDYKDSCSYMTLTPDINSVLSTLFERWLKPRGEDKMFLLAKAVWHLTFILFGG